MPVTLATLPRNEGKNPAGLAKLYAIPVSSVTGIPDPTDMVVSADITVLSGEVFVEFELDPEANGVVTVESPESEGGTGCNYMIDCFFPGNTAAQKNSIEKVDGVPCIWIGEDKAGTAEILGEMNRGIRLRPAKEDGNKPGTARGHRLKGQTDYNHLPYEYTGAIPT